MALKLTKKPAVATVTEQELKKGVVVAEQTTQEEVIAPSEAEITPGPHCDVGVEMSYTHNLGNYESARVAVSLRIPCLPAEIDSVFDYGKAWVDSKMQTMIAELKE
jgi:hypothetical protein